MKFYSIAYLNFFIRKLCFYILRKCELPTSDRKDMFFLAHNDHIGSTIQAYGYYEREFLICVEFLAVRLGITSKTAVDVGANIGNHTLYFSRIFGSVIAFEPSPPLGFVLQANVMRNCRENVEIFCCGLGDEDGEAVVNDLTHEHTGMVELERISAINKPVGLKTVPICKADDVLFARKSPIGFVKIDVEGMEVSVLEGMRMCILRDHPIVAFESRGFNEGDGVIRLLSDMGYSYFYEISSSRVSLGRGFDIRNLFSLRKSYSLKRIKKLEDRFYSTIFASVNDIVG